MDGGEDLRAVRGRVAVANLFWEQRVERLMDDLQRLNVIITGRVQGVGFRFFAERIANRLGLVGFTRNLPSGPVEVVAEGDQPPLEELLAALREGPAAAQISDIAVHWAPATGEFDSFGVRYW